MRGTAVYLHTKVSQDLHRQIVHSLTLSFYKPLLFLGLGERKKSWIIMKKWLLLVCGSLIFGLSSCMEKLDNEKCTKLILSHPFFNYQHIGVSSRELPDCKSVFAGSIPKAYWHVGNDFTTAYYYYLYGFGIMDICNLSIEDNKAICEFDLVKIHETEAFKHIKDDRIKEGKIHCHAIFMKYEDSGWKLRQIVPSKRLFMINIWDQGQYKAMVNFNSFQE